MDNFDLKKYLVEGKLNEGALMDEYPFHDELAQKLGWDDFSQMKMNEDEIPDYAKTLFDMVCDLSGKLPAWNKLTENQTQSKYNEFMLEWIVPGEESNTLISKNLKELFRVIEEKNIGKYTIKGWNGRTWDILIK
jgi:hypothetical protein